MAERRAFAAVLRAERQAMDAERAAFAAEVVAAVRRHATGERFGALQRAFVLRDVEPILDEFYGVLPGDERARFWRHTVRECRSARAGVWGRAERLVRRLLRGQPELLRAIEREAA